MINIRNKRLDQSQLTCGRQSVNSSIATQGKDYQQLEKSFYQISQEQKVKQHTLPALQEKKGLFEQIFVAVHEKLNDDFQSTIFRQTQYKTLIKKSNKTLKLKTNNTKIKFKRQQSVIETNINQNCMIKGNWISCEQNWFPQFREFGQMVSHQGSIYLSGGFGNSVNNDFCQFDLTSNKWSSLQNVIPRYGHTMTSILSELYVIGGEQINNYGPLRSKCFVNEIQKFDGEKWHTIRYAGIFQMRKYHAATSYKDSIFIVGGEGFKNKVLSDTMIFDAIHSRFHEVPNPKNMFAKGIMHTAIVEAQETIYLYGGVDQNDEIYDQLYTYDSIQNWKQKETIGSKPPKLMMHTMVYYDPFILLYGGKIDDLQETTFSNKIYALKNNEWFIIEQEGAIPQPRAGHSSCIDDNKLLIFGGFNYDGYLSCQMQIMEFKRVYQINRIVSLPALKSEPAEISQCQRKTFLLRTRFSLLK
ncbi:unnamed protein product [Paramecium sonneborni]|uniref:Attractin/MKLN-like beta-propeller domain-containing protein n=1 Tax=Paramecium sonneborni TaxID=65129 RepID=A0A8S1KPA3_9CILI|nr:unnamed protein product [Paramecium sonneborni]